MLHLLHDMYFLLKNLLPPPHGEQGSTSLMSV